MITRNVSTIGAASILLMLAFSTAWADDVTIAGGDLTANGATQTTLSANGGGKIIFATSHDLILTGTALTAVTGIQVNNGVTADINFGGTTNTITFATTGAAIDLQGTGTLTIAGTDSSAGFTFGAATGQTLTVNGSVAGGVAANKFVIGNNTLQVTTAATFAGTVSAGGASAVWDIDAATTIATPVMTGALNITPADTIVLTLTNALSVGGNTLTCTGSGAGGADSINGTITLNNASSILSTAGVDADDILGDVTVTVTADGATLDVNFNTSPVAVNMSNALTLNVATGKTLTTTVAVGAKALTLGETGTISTITGTTGSITDNGGGTITALTLTPGGGGTFTFGGTGTSTVTTLTATNLGDLDVFAKTGTGTLTITNGLLTPMNKAGGQIFNVNAGTLIVGAAGSNDNITFAQDTDEITVASGATLTTYGSFVVSAAGANTNLDAAAGSVVNLSSTAGAEGLTAAANDDYKLLGTVNINGANGDYTINDAFDYKFGDLNINNTGSLINNNASGEIKFVDGTTVTLAGNATLTMDGQATGTRITVDTVSGVGIFGIARASSTNMTMANIAMSHCGYSSNAGLPAECELTGLTGMSYVAGNSNWTGSCTTGTPATGGGTTTEDTATDDATDEDTTEDDATDDATDDGTTDDNSIDDGTGDDTDDGTGDGAEPDGTEDTGTIEAGTDGTASVSTATANATIQGVEEGTAVNLDSDENGDSTLTLSDTEGNLLFSLAVEGAGAGSGIAVAVDAAGNQAVTVTTATGATIQLNLDSIPAGAEVNVITNETGDVTITVTDPSGEAVDVTIETPGAGEAVVFNITYMNAPTNAKVYTGYPGFEDQQSVGGAVSISSPGLPPGVVSHLALGYYETDLGGINEADLRIQMLDQATETYGPVGPNDMGDSAPTGNLGDFGVQTDLNSTWAEIEEFGTFAIGVPKVAAEQPVEPEPTTTTGCGAGAAPCGTTGMLTWMMMTLGLVALRRTSRNR